MSKISIRYGTGFLINFNLEIRPITSTGKQIVVRRVEMLMSNLYKIIVTATKRFSSEHWMMLLKHFILVTCIHSVSIIIKTSVAWVTLLPIWQKLCYEANTKTLLQRPFQIEFTNVSTRSFVNSNEVNSSISATGSISFYVNLLQDVASVYAITEILVESTRGKYDLELVNKTINYCRFLSDRKYEPIAQVFYKMFSKSSNFPKSCPIRKVIMCEDCKGYEVFSSSLFKSNF